MFLTKVEVKESRVMFTPDFLNWGNTIKFWYNKVLRFKSYECR
jgi:hypothetical protein